MPSLMNDEQLNFAYLAIISLDKIKSKLTNDDDVKDAVRIHKIVIDPDDGSNAGSAKIIAGTNEINFEATNIIIN